MPGFLYTIYVQNKQRKKEMCNNERDCSSIK